MMKVVCSICGRFRYKEEKEDPQGRESNDICARCYCAFYYDEESVLKELMEKYIREESRYKRDNGEDMWQGTEQFRRGLSAEGIEFYNGLVKKLLATEVTALDKR